jgi:hypothetical protein
LPDEAIAGSLNVRTIHETKANFKELNFYALRISHVVSFSRKRGAIKMIRVAAGRRDFNDPCLPESRIHATVQKNQQMLKACSLK